MTTIPNEFSSVCDRFTRHSNTLSALSPSELMAVGVDARLVPQDRRMSPSNSSSRGSVCVGEVMGVMSVMGVMGVMDVGLVGGLGSSGGERVMVSLCSCSCCLAEERSWSLTEDSNSLEISGVVLVMMMMVLR